MSQQSISASPYTSPSPSPTPTRTKHSIPRPPASPLRPGSPSLPPTPRRTSSLTSPALSASAALKSPSTPPPATKTRARDLLRKHYGLGVGPPPPLVRSDSGGKSNDPMDLDSAAFDARSYYEQLITISSLPTLLKRENDLLTEIRQLDGERQSLVYNHHHELIAASDTIAAMKTRADGLDADLDLLREAFSEISRLGAEVAIEQTDGTGFKGRT